MVTQSTRSIVFWIAVMTCVVMVGWILVPDITTTRSDPYVKLIGDVLGKYQENSGRLPANLVVIEPFLASETGKDWKIKREGRNTYHVTVNTASQGRKSFRVEYAVGREGLLEKYDVRNVDDTDAD